MRIAMILNAFYMIDFIKGRGHHKSGNFLAVFLPTPYNLTDFERICADFENNFALSEKNDKFCNKLSFKISTNSLKVSQIIGGVRPWSYDGKSQ